MVLLFTISNAEGQGQSYDSFRKLEGLVCKQGALTVFQHENHVYLEIPELLLGRDFLFVAQVNKGAEMIARPLTSVGVFCFRLGEKGKIYFYQDKYQERIVSKNHPLADIFENSNMQPVADVFDIVVADSVRKKYVIDITNVLMKGKKWFLTKHPQLRAAGNDMELIDVVSNDEGVIFTFQKEFSYAYLMEAAGVKGCEGTITVELGGMLKLLPQEKMVTKKVGNIRGVRSVRYSVYGSDPYGVVHDSLLMRWRLQIPEGKQKIFNRGHKISLVQPLVIYVDHSFPDKWFPYAAKAVSYWNAIFEEIGYKDALQIRKLSDALPNVGPDALIAYDLSEPSVVSDIVCHPETGEILRCRINIGHGIWDIKRVRNYLLYGLDARGCFLDFESQDMAGELLYTELCGEIGKILGLQGVESRERDKDLIGYIYGNSFFEIGDEEKKTIEHSLKVLEKNINMVQQVYQGFVDDKVKNCVLQETEEGRKHICDVRNEMFKEYLMSCVNLLQTVATKEELNAIMRFFDIYFFASEIKLGNEYVQDILKCMMDERTMKHLESIDLLDDWFSIIQSVVVDKIEEVHNLRRENINLCWNVVGKLVEQAIRMKIAACDEDFQAIFYFKLEELYSQLSQRKKACYDEFAMIFYKKLLKKLETVVIP